MFRHVLLVNLKCMLGKIIQQPLTLCCGFISFKMDDLFGDLPPPGKCFLVSNFYKIRLMEYFAHFISASEGGISEGNLYDDVPNPEFQSREKKRKCDKNDSNEEVPSKRPVTRKYYKHIYIFLIAM